MNLPIFIYCLILALLIGAYNYAYLKASQLHRFMPFLFLTLAVELVAFYLMSLGKNNATLYNGYVLIQVLFCIWYFINTGLSTMFRRILHACMIIYIMAALINYVFFIGPQLFSYWLFHLGGFLVIVAGLIFLFNYFLLDNSRLESILSPVVTITIGLIAYFSVVSICISFADQIKSYNLRIRGEMLHNFMPRMISIILYLCFAYAFFICRKRVTT